MKKPPPRISDTEVLEAAFSVSRHTTLSEKTRLVKAAEICLYCINNGFSDREVVKLLLLLASLLNKAEFVMPLGPIDSPVWALEKVAVVLKQMERKLNWQMAVVMLVRELIPVITERQAALDMMAGMAGVVL